jgi:hypothetical protein
LLKNGQWEDGVSELREALRRDPNNADLQRGIEDAVEQAKSHGIVISKP